MRAFCRYVLRMSANKSPIQLKIVREDADAQNLFGWAYVSRYSDGTLVEDKWRAHIPPDVLESAAYDFMASGNAVAGQMHGRDKKGNPVAVGVVIESLFLDSAKAKLLGVENAGDFAGWWIGMHITNADTWGKIKDGTYADLSIGGEAVFVEIDDETDLEEACKDMKRNAPQEMDREDPNQRKIVKKLRLKEVSVVTDGGHQDAHIALIRAGDEVNMKALAFIRAAMVVAAAVPNEIARKGIDYKTAYTRREMEEKIRAMLDSFYSIIYGSEDESVMATDLLASAQQFYDDIVAEQTSEEEMGRSVPVDILTTAASVLEAISRGDVAQVKKIMGQTQNPKSPSPINLDDMRRQAAQLPENDPAAQLARSLLQAADEMRAANTELVRQRNEAARTAEDAEITRAYQPYESAAGIPAAQLTKLVRTAREAGLENDLKTVLERAAAASAVVTSQFSRSPAPAPSPSTVETAGALTRASIESQIAELALKLQTEQPTQYRTEAMARAAAWGKRPDLFAQYQSAR